MIEPPNLYGVYASFEICAQGAERTRGHVIRDLMGGIDREFCKEATSPPVYSRLAAGRICDSLHLHGETLRLALNENGSV